MVGGHLFFSEDIVTSLIWVWTVGNLASTLTEAILDNYYFCEEAIENTYNLELFTSKTDLQGKANYFCNRAELYLIYVIMTWYLSI